MISISVVSENGELTIPRKFLELDNITPGTDLELERISNRMYLLRVPTGKPFDLAQWKLDHPEKDWFTTIESESTDSSSEEP